MTLPPISPHEYRRLREQFAAAALNGLLVQQIGVLCAPSAVAEVKRAAQLSMSAADALLTALYPEGPAPVGPFLPPLDLGLSAVAEEQARRAIHIWLGQLEPLLEEIAKRGCLPPDLQERLIGLLLQAATFLERSTEGDPPC